MKKPETQQELQDTFSQLITDTKEQLLSSKTGKKQYLNYNDFLHICNTVKSTYCTLMGVEEAPAGIVEACNKTLDYILQYRPPSSIGGIVGPGDPVTELFNIARRLTKSSVSLSAEAEQILRESLHSALEHTDLTTETNNI